MKTTILSLGLVGAMLGATSALAQTAPTPPPVQPTPAADTVMVAKADTQPPKTPADKLVCHTVAREGTMTRKTICN